MENRLTAILDASPDEAIQALPAAVVAAAVKSTSAMSEDDDNSDEEYVGKLRSHSANHKSSTVTTANGTHAATTTSTTTDTFCVECEDQPVSLFCLQCTDDYCDVCFQSIHRKGQRRRHQAKRVHPQQPTTNTTTATTNDGMEMSPELSATQHPAPDELLITAEELLEDVARVNSTLHSSSTTSSSAQQQESFLERSKWIPVRLSLVERKRLRLLEAALNVSEYTDNIDILSYRSNKPQRIIKQIKDLCAILCGLVVAADYEAGQELIADKDYKLNENFFQRVFEIGRRHKVSATSSEWRAGGWVVGVDGSCPEYWKICNPEKMRTTYGKLVFLLMDAVSPEVQDLLEFTCVAPIVTVYSTLEKRGSLMLLEDPLVEVATREIIPEGKSRYEIQKEIKQKERAIEMLARKYQKKDLSDEEIKTCLYRWVIGGEEENMGGGASGK